jgi:glycerate dehydrogenase
MQAQPAKTVFLDYDTVSADDLDLSTLRAASGSLILYDTDEALTAERIRDAEVVLLNKLELNRLLLFGAPNLKLIALAATGTNNIDLSAARERGIGVCNVRAYCTASVVQHVWGLILSLTQHVGEFSQASMDGSWARDESSAVLAHPIRELEGRVFGVVGWGELGRGAARIAEAFGMRVIVANRPGSAPQSDRVPFEELLATADIISLHCPLNEATRGLIGERELQLMKSDALLINTARGALIDGAALAAALKSRRLGGAGIDVLPHEPPLDNEPLIDGTIPNLLVTPHIAWAAREARQRCIDEMAANIRDFYSGGHRGRVV